MSHLVVVYHARNSRYGKNNGCLCLFSLWYISNDIRVFLLHDFITHYGIKNMQLVSTPY